MDRTEFMDRFVNISVHKSQNGQKYILKWLTVGFIGAIASKYGGHRPKNT